jgi:hypothetical protein
LFNLVCIRSCSRIRTSIYRIRTSIYRIRTSISRGIIKSIIRNQQEKSTAADVVYNGLNKQTSFDPSLSSDAKFERIAEQVTGGKLISAGNYPIDIEGTDRLYEVKYKEVPEPDINIAKKSSFIKLSMPRLPQLNTKQNLNILNLRFPTLIKLLNKNREGYFLEYVIGAYIKLNIKFVSYEVDGFDRYFETIFYSI